MNSKLKNARPPRFAFDRCWESTALKKKIGNGGFATVYRAMDTIEGIRVAIKIPYPHLVDDAMMDSFRQEVRTVAKLDHPHILGVKDASVIDGHFVIVTLMGDEPLDARLTRRLAARTALEWSVQLMEALAYAHHMKVVHCDIKPENILVFTDSHVRLTDFGIAKIGNRTIMANGTGTVGYMAPEQAMGRPSARSDVFSLGLLMYRMLSGSWPEWPFDWPPPAAAKMRKRGIHPDLLRFLRRSIEVRSPDRFRDAGVMLKEYRKIESRVLRNLARKRKPASAK